MEATPKTLIRALIAEKDSSSSSTVETNPLLQTARVVPTRGGAGSQTLEEDETPRRIINALAAGLNTDSALSLNNTRRPSKRLLESNNDNEDETPNGDARKMIRQFIRVASTDSRPKNQQSPDWNGVEDAYEEDEKYKDDEFEAEEEDQGSQVAAKVLPKATSGVFYTHAKKPPMQQQPRRKTVVTSPYEDFFSFSCLALPRPNRVSNEGMKVVETAVRAYLERTIRDYSRLARIDGASTHHLTRSRLEHLLRQQGLLNGPLGDEVSRLLDHDDAVKALALPISRAKQERM